MTTGASSISPTMRCLRILETVSASPNDLTSTEVADQLGLPKQSVHRLCRTLLSQGFLEHGSRKTLRPSVRARRLGSGLVFASRFHHLRHEILDGLSRKVKETVNFVVPEEAGMVYIDRVETNWGFVIQLPIGTHVPFHCTASGKTYLASLGLRARERIVSQMTLKPHTPNTLCHTEALLAEIREVERRGYALDREEFFEGMVAIAAPVTDAVGRYVAAIAFHGSTQRLSYQHLINHSDTLLQTARFMSESLFGPSPDPHPDSPL